MSSEANNIDVKTKMRGNFFNAVKAIMAARQEYQNSKLSEENKSKPQEKIIEENADETVKLIQKIQKSLKEQDNILGVVLGDEKIDYIPKNRVKIYTKD